MTDLDVAPGDEDRRRGGPARASFDRDLANVARARDWVRAELRRASPGAPDDCEQLALVAVSELVTNVLRHTDSPANVSVQVDGQRVRVEVSDGEWESVPVLRPIDPGRVGGNGIRIIDALAERWGCEVQPGQGKRVWFTLSW